MKKTHILVCLLLVCIIQSCDKSKELSSSVMSKHFKLTGQEAKDYYLTKYASLIESQTNLGKNGMKIVPSAWERNMEISYEQVSILKVALSEYIYTPSMYAFRDIVFKKEKDGSISELLMEVRVDTSYIFKKTQRRLTAFKEIRCLVDNKDFTGYIFLYKINNKQFIKGRYYESGKPTKDYSRKNDDIQSSISRSLRSSIASGEQSGDDDIWDGGYNSNLDVIVTTTSPGAPSFGGWVFPGLPDSYFIGGAGSYGGSGGGTSQSGDGAVTGGPIYSVSDNLKNPCIDSVFAKINNSTIELVVANFLNTLKDSKSYSFEFDDSWTEGSFSQPAQTKPVWNGQTLVGFKIVLQGNEVKTFSKEAITGIILHEIVHGYWLNKDASIESQGSHHVDMLNSAIDDIVAAQTSLFPDLPVIDAYAMAMFGLSNILEKGTDEDKMIFNANLKSLGLTMDEVFSIYKKYTIGDKNEKLGQRC